MNKPNGMWNLTEKVYDILNAMNIANILLEEDKVGFTVDTFRDTTELGIPMSLQYILSRNFRVNIYKDERIEIILKSKLFYDDIQQLVGKLKEISNVDIDIDSQARSGNGLPFKCVIDLGNEESNLTKMLQIIEIMKNVGL